MTKSDKARRIIMFGIGIVLTLGLYGCSAQNTSDFESLEKIDESNVEISYISVVYLDGYSYEPSEWYAYSSNENFKDRNYNKGNKIGQTTLDLKGKVYEGTPPDFSTTYSIGADLYEIEGFKKEYAILIESGNVSDVLYRTGKAVSNEDESIGLKVDDVINMISDNPNINSLELRSEMDASLVRTISDNELTKLIYKDIKDKDIYTYEELKSTDDLSGLRIPINLVLEKDVLLHMQVYPESNTASIFRGYIDISDDLANRLLKLNLDDGDFGDNLLNDDNKTQQSGPDIDLLRTQYLITNNLENVSMTIKNDTVSSTGLTVVFENNSKADCIYGQYFSMEKNIDGDWFQVPVIIDNYGFEDIGYELSANASGEWSVNWDWLYGSLEEGEYRIIKNVLDFKGTGDYDEYYLTAEFTLGDKEG